MEMQLFTIRDNTAEYYQKPIMFRNVGDALRAFMNLLEDKENMIGLHPECFTLYHIGSWSENTGLYTSLPSPVVVGNAWELIKDKGVK